MHIKGLPTLNKVITKCTVHYTVQFQYNISLVRMKARDPDVLAWVQGLRKMSQELGAFGMLDFSTLRPVLAWRAFWNLRTVYFFNILIFFRSAVNHGY
jgi:hypothetical protein